MSSAASSAGDGARMWPVLAADQTAIAELCRRLGIRRLAAFGSAVAGGFDEARSDVDVLVAFDPDRRERPYEDYVELKEDLEALLGRPADLVTPEALTNPYFAAWVSRTEVKLYASRDRCRRPGYRLWPRHH